MPRLAAPLNRTQAKHFLAVNAGCFMFAAGLVFFRNPNRFASGGMSGLSLLISAYLPSLPVGLIMIILNTLILGVGWLVLGRKRTMQSVYGTFALSGFVWLLEVLFPLSAPVTDQKLLELIYSVFLPGFGSALVFHFGATTGGTDVVAQILSNFFKWKISISLLVLDFFIALGAGLIYGAEACLYSVLGVCLRLFLMNAVMENLRTHKVVVIISEKSADIQHFICHELRRGATVHTARGAYTIQDKEVITTVLGRRQAVLLQQYIKAEDPGAFITITNTTEIIGLGFDRFG